REQRAAGCRAVLSRPAASWGTLDRARWAGLRRLCRSLSLAGRAEQLAFTLAQPADDADHCPRAVANCALLLGRSGPLAGRTGRRLFLALTHFLPPLSTPNPQPTTARALLPRVLLQREQVVL